MKEMLLEMVKDRVDEIAEQQKRETLAFSIKKMMSNLKLTLEQAMDVLCIPMAQRAIYAGLVQHG